MKKINTLLLTLISSFALTSCDLSSALGGLSLPNFNDHPQGNSENSKQQDILESNKEHVHDWKYDGTVKKPNCKEEEGEDFYKCETCGALKTVSTATTENHNYVLDEFIIPPTCTNNGTQRQTCTICGKTTNGVALATGHDFESNKTQVEADENHTPYTFSTCSKEDGNMLVQWDSHDYTELHGTFKGGHPDDAIKFANNGDYLRYNISANTLVHGKIYILASMDQWGVDSYYLDYTMESRKNGEGLNFRLTINGTEVQIPLSQRTKPYGELIPTRTTIGDNYSELTWIELGEATIYGDENIIEYTRLDSFNLSIKEFRIIGTN